MRRVRTIDSWIVNQKWLVQLQPKFNLLTAVVVLISLFITIDFAQVSPAIAVGNLFLSHTDIAAFIATIVALILRDIIHQPSKLIHKSQLDFPEIAYLAGGKTRAVELAIAKLAHEGYLLPNV